MDEGGTIDGDGRCDIAGMARIHHMFRAGFGEAPALVDGVADGDITHVERVAAHLSTLSTALHAHHEGEETLVWDRLTTRAPGCALHVERMRIQHAAMLRHLDALDRVLPAWRVRGAREDAATVVAALDALNAALAEHLPDEERTVVPVMDEHLSVQEAQELSTHGRRATPKGAMWQVLGAIVAAQPDGGEQFLRDELPAPVRLLWRTVGRRRYDRHRASLTGAR